MEPRDAGVEALNYFQESNPDAEAMAAGSNEAEWIVDLTTHADRDNKCALSGCITMGLGWARPCRSSCGFTETHP